jgi:hypothetical protein
MTLAVLVSIAARVDNTGGGGPLTLVFPLVLVFIVAGLWVISLRRSRNE